MNAPNVNGVRVYLATEPDSGLWYIRAYSYDHAKCVTLAVRATEAEALDYFGSVLDMMTW